MRNLKEHGQRRRLFARGFSKTYLREHWEPTVREKAVLAVEKIKADAISGTSDLMKWWTFMATDIVGVLGFGESFGMLELGQVMQSYLFTFTVNADRSPEDQVHTSPRESTYR